MSIRINTLSQLNFPEIAEVENEIKKINPNLKIIEENYKYYIAYNNINIMLLDYRNRDTLSFLLLDREELINKLKNELENLENSLLKKKESENPVFGDPAMQDKIWKIGIIKTKISQLENLSDKEKEEIFSIYQTINDMEKIANKKICVK